MLCLFFLFNDSGASLSFKLSIFLEAFSSFFSRNLSLCYLKKDAACMFERRLCQIKYRVSSCFNIQVDNERVLILYSIQK